MPDFALPNDNKDAEGNPLYPADPHKTIVTSPWSDEVNRALLDSILRSPSSERTITPEDDFRALVLEAFTAGSKVAAAIQSIAHGVTSTISDHAVLNNEHTILVDTSDGNVTIFLPPAADNPGRILYVKKTAGPDDIGSNDVILSPTAPDTIDGDPTARIAFLHTTARLASDASGWWLT
jgi:hypothetical protein